MGRVPSGEALAQLPGQKSSAETLNLDLDATVERMLGQLWNFTTDCFIFKVIPKQMDRVTKRGILRAVASIFDPLGFLAPVLITAKILLQDVWRTGADWDDDLPDEIVHRWHQWADNLPALEKVKIPRCFTGRRDGPASQELHVFSDASELAYGACAFLLSRFTDGPDEISPIMARARVASVKYETIPKKELNGAVVGYRMMLTIIQELGLENIPVFLWTDSTTVLRWLESTSAKLPAFVANRVGEMLETSVVGQYRFVPTHLNPADFISRGIDPADLRSDHPYYFPEILRMAPEDWPKSPLLSKEEANRPIDFAGAIIKPPPSPDVKALPFTGAVIKVPSFKALEIDEMINDSTHLNTLKRRVAYLLRWTRNAQPKRFARKSGPLDADDLQDALDFIIRRAQLAAYPTEIRAVERGQPLPPTSTLVHLSPFINRKGLLASGGRLANAPLDFNARHPVFLPPKAWITRLIVLEIHRSHAHSRTEATLHRVRQQYWITKGTQTVKHLIHPCILCRRKRAKPIQPRMADLPAFRLGLGLPAFHFTGVDYFGPYQIKKGRSLLKRWIAIFTCGTTRAVHLEVAHELSTDSFLNALFRFESLRGQPAEYHSDNGTNFVGAKNELDDCFAALDHEVIRSRLAARGANWRFNPPCAPHMGGAWEALVHSAKRALHFVLDGRTLDDEAFATSIALVTGLLNGRPLTVLNDDPANPEPLTPNHLLLGRANPSIPPDIFHEREMSSRRRWRVAQLTAQLFWQRWMREYAPTLMARRKWSTSDHNLRVDDIVAVLDRKNPRGHWIMGRVIRAIPGPDGVVRSAIVVVPKRGSRELETIELHRPATGLALLEPAQLDPPINTIVSSS